MLALYIEDDFEIANIINIKIQALTGYKVIHKTSISDVLEYLDTEPDLNIVISQFKINNKIINSIYHHIIENQLNLPLVILNAKEEELKKVEEFKHFLTDHPGNGIVNNIIYEKDFNKKIENALNPGEKKTNEQKIQLFEFEEYEPINAQLLYKFEFLPCDIYIKLSENKHVKIIQKMHEYSKEDIDKYTKKNIDLFYVKGNDIEYFSSFCLRQLSSKLKNDSNKNVNVSEVVEVQKQVFKTIQNKLNSIGITPATMELMNTTIKTSVKVIEANPSLRNLLKNMKSSDGFINEHAQMLAYFTCLVEGQMDWNSNETKSKLAMASILHDITLKDSPELKEVLLYPEKIDLLSDKDKKKYLNHPLEVAALIKHLGNIPPDVEGIIGSHHKLPMTGGFPMPTLHISRVTPLQAIFILCHQFLIMLYRENFTDEGQSNALEFLSKNYNSDSFKKPLQALIKLFDN